MQLLVELLLRFVNVTRRETTRRRWSLDAARVLVDKADGRFDLLVRFEYLRVD